MTKRPVPAPVPIPSPAQRAVLPPVNLASMPAPTGKPNRQAEPILTPSTAERAALALHYASLGLVLGIAVGAAVAAMTGLGA